MLFRSAPAANVSLRSSKPITTATPTQAPVLTANNAAQANAAAAANRPVATVSQPKPVTAPAANNAAQANAAVAAANRPVAATVSQPKPATAPAANKSAAPVSAANKTAAQDIQSAKKIAEQLDQKITRRNRFTFDGDIKQAKLSDIIKMAADEAKDAKPIPSLSSTKSSVSSRIIKGTTNLLTQMDKTNIDELIQKGVTSAPGALFSSVKSFVNKYGKYAFQAVAAGTPTAIGAERL